MAVSKELQTGKTGGMFDNLPPEDDIRPDPNLGSEDSIFKILYDTIIGEQGVPQGVSPEVLSAIEGRFRANPNISVLEEIARQIAEAGGWDAWAEQNGFYGDTTNDIDDADDSDSDTDSDSDADSDGGNEDTRDIFQEILDDAEATGEEITEETVATARDIANEIGRTVLDSIPKNPNDLKDLIVKIIRSTSGIAKDCETWTDRVPEGEGGSGSVPGSAGGTYAGWKDCVNLGVILSIPGINIPLPPGMVDITWKDLEDLVKEAGQDIRDVLEDPGGWLEETLEEAKEKVREILADIRGGISNKTLGGIIEDAVGGYIGTLIISEIEEEIEENNPFLNLSEEDSCANGATNFPECTECPEGFQYFEGTGECEPEKQAPIETAPEDCEDQVFADQNPDICGDSLEGNQDDRNQECKKQLATESAYYDTELKRCVVPIEDQEPEFGYCEDGETPRENRAGTNCPEYVDPAPFDYCEDGTTPKQNEEGTNCPEYEPPGPEFGYCEDGQTEKADTEGSNCPENQVVDFGLCEDGITPKEDEEGSNCPDVVTPVDFGMCDDGVTQKQDEEGNNCPDIGIPSFGLCDDGVTEKQDEEGSNCPGAPPVTEDPDEEECANGADDWPLCSECSDGSRPSDHENGICPPDVIETPPPADDGCEEGFKRDPETGECIPVVTEQPPVDSGGGGSGGSGGMFTPFMAGINYQLPEIQPLVLPQTANDMMGGLLTRLIVDRNK